MGATLNAQASTWTKWHQERAMNTDMDKDMRTAPNQKYIKVIFNRLPRLNPSKPST